MVDPVGAGDAFAAGCLSGRLRGPTPDARLAGAATVAAMVVQCAGDVQRLPTRAERDRAPAAARTAGVDLVVRQPSEETHVYRWEAMRVLTAQRVIGIVRAPAAEPAVATATGMLRAGLRTLEIALTTPGGLDAIRAVRADAPADALVGAGTVLDAATVRAAIDAGARFLVAPNLEPAVIRAGHRYGVPVIPGVATATELVRALELGADAVKVFPASQHGPRWLSDLRAALPQAPLVPTGGVTAATAPEWVAAGAVACGMGSSLTSGGPREAAERVAALLAVLGGTPAGGQRPGGADR